MASYSWPGSRQTVLDHNGQVQRGARLKFYQAGTTTPLTAYQDAALTVPYPATIVADAAGRWPRVFLPYTDYDEQVATAAGSQLWYDEGISNPAPASSGGGSTVPDEERVKTGFIRPVFDEAPTAGYVRLNGLTIGNVASGATERANSDTEALYVYLWNRLADAYCPVTGGRGGSALADYSAGKAMGLPDLRGRTLFGTDDMGNASAASRLVHALFGAGDAITIGSNGGNSGTTLLRANLPAVSPAITVADTSQKSISYTTTSINNGTTNNFATAVNGIFTSGGGTAIQTTQTTTGSVTATIEALGSGQVFSSISPFMLCAWIIKL